MTGRVLVVDDDAAFCDTIVADLRLRGLETSSYTSANAAFLALKDETFDVVLTDLNMSGLNGIELCERIVANRPDVPVVVMTAFGSLETAIEAIRAGAYDFVTKPVEMDVLALALERALSHRALREQVRVLSEAVERTQRFGDLFGASPPMQRLYDQLERIAASEASVLLMGESGTGKELVARAIHRSSPRREGPFVPISCAALPDALLESELFGHTRGAFTDATSARTGVFAQASGGTLFLDEIGDLPLTLQPKLLRALEERVVRPLGAGTEVSVDVRILAATNRDLEAAVEEKQFRADLFFRLNAIQVELPPLRARGTDILLLAKRFVDQFTGASGKKIVGISTPAAEKLMSYSWPGNVRELRNAMERAVALSRYDRIAVEDLPERVRAYRSSPMVLGGEDPTELVPLETVERRYIQHVLRAVGGNRTLAARVLGLDRKTLYRKLLQFEGSDATKGS